MMSRVLRFKIQLFNQEFRHWLGLAWLGLCLLFCGYSMLTLNLL